MTAATTATPERPIIFRPAAMTRAALDGRKTQGRWPVEPQPPCDCGYVINGARSHALCYHLPSAPGGKFTADTVWVPPTPRSTDHRLACPFGPPGGRLSVLEPWITLPFGRVFYEADGPMPPGWKWRRPEEMPRRFSRLLLEVAAVRVERVRDIGHRGCVAEGWPGPDDKRTWIEAMGDGDDGCIEWYADQWDALHGAGAWDRNDWVWVVAFRPVASNPASTNVAPAQDDAISKGI